MTRTIMLSVVLLLPSAARAAGTRDDLIDVLSSTEVQEIEKSIPVGGGDFAYHFVQARWEGSEMRYDEVTGSQAERTMFALRYADNFAPARFCEVKLALLAIWPRKEPSKVTKKVLVDADSCSRGRSLR